MQAFSVPALAEIPASASLADIVVTRAERRPDDVIMRRRTGPAQGQGQWQDVTAAVFRAEVEALAAGLVAAGLEPGDRVGLMSQTRYEWTLIDYAIWTAGGVTVPVYETSSAEQVEWMLGDSGARGVFAEHDTHAAAINAVAGRLPSLDLGVWTFDEIGKMSAQLAGTPAGAGDRPGPGPGDPAGAAADIASRRGLRGAADLATIVYTSGTTGRPKGCQLTHGNLLSDVRNAVDGPLASVLSEPGASTLLFLPLAHSFARIIQIGCLEAGAVLGHWADTRTLAAGLAEFRPTFLLAVPRVFEKVFNTAQQEAASSPAKARIFAAAAATAEEWSRAGAAADAVRGPGLRLRHALYDRLVYSRLRAAIGGQVRYAVSGGAPLGDRLGHFFRGIGIPVLEGYGLTETSAAATVNRPDRQRIGTVGQPLPGVSVRIADDGEILLSGPAIFGGYWQNPDATAEGQDADGWLRTGDLGSLDDTGFLSVTGRKKELIVTAAGKNVAPAVLEDRIRAHPLISQAMVVGDQKPYIACLLTLDDEAFGRWKTQNGKPSDASPADLAGDPDLIATLQAAIDDANLAVSRAESIRRFTVLAEDFTEASGHLTPSLKVKRAQVMKDFADQIEGLYTKSGSAPAGQH